MFGDCYQGRRVMVTGHTGFKGSWLVAWLNRLGAKVLGYALGEVSEPSHWKRLQPACESVCGDVRDASNLHKVVQRFEPEVVFHLAAQPLVRASYADPLETYTTNVIGTANVLQAIRTCDSITAVVVVTTDKCYENLGQGSPFVEDAPLGGHDPYSASKAAAEIVTASFRKSFFNPVTFGKDHRTLIASARAGNVIGGGDWAEDRLVPDLIRAITANQTLDLRKPDATRPWQHVLDPLAGYLLLGQHLLSGETRCATSYNFGPDDTTGLPVREVVERFTLYLPQLHVRYTPEQATLHEADLLVLDSGKAKRDLGWQPLWDSSVAIQQTANWYKRYLADETLMTEKDLDQFCAQMMGVMPS